MTAPTDLKSLYRLRDLIDRSQGFHGFTPEPHQIPPTDFGFVWLFQGGRGSGKTGAAAHYVAQHLDAEPCITKELPHRVALIAPTIGDAVESADLTPVSLTRMRPGAKLHSRAGGTFVDWPNGSQVRLFGAYTRDDVNRLRAGGNRCLVWAEELAAWRYLREAWDHMEFGLRLGPNPHVVGTTTPQPRPEYVELTKRDDVTVTRGSLRDNPYLPDARKQALIDRYDGTALGKQELDGELIEEAEGALWSYVLIHAAPSPGEFDLGRVVVAVDPPGGQTEAGIVAAGVLPGCRCGSPGPLPHFAVLADRSDKLSPAGWGGRSLALLDELVGDRIVGESNFGGDMVEATIRNLRPSAPFKKVSASRGKRVRAEPVKALYEKQRVHHAAAFPELEAEMVQWVPDESSWSPNRLDAMVWALTELAGTGEPTIWLA